MYIENLVYGTTVKLDLTELVSFSNNDLKAYIENQLIGIITNGIKITKVNKIKLKNDRILLNQIRDCFVNADFEVDVDGIAFKPDERIKGEIEVINSVCYLRHEDFLFKINANDINISYTWINIDGKRIENNSIVDAKINNVLTVEGQRFFEGSCMLI